MSASTVASAEGIKSKVYNVPPAGEVREELFGGGRRVFSALPAHDERKFRYNPAGVVSRGVDISFSVNKADRMDPYEAGEMLHRIHVALKLDNAVEETINAFDKALFFEHTINGASKEQPDRGDIVVNNVVYRIEIVLVILGDDLRRFFRAFADEVKAVNKEVLAGIDPAKVETLERHAQLMQVAHERGIQRYPYLAHDSADACTLLRPDERRAISFSKNLVLKNLEG